MKMKFIIGLAISSLLFIDAKSQDEWSLTDCINYAHANNITIKRQELQAEIAENDYFESKMQILPSLNAEAYRNYNFGRQVDPYTNDFITDNTMSDSYSIYASLNLFAGLRTYNAIQANKFNSLSMMQNVEKERVNIAIEIASAYLKILFSKELLEVAKSQKEVTELQVERTAKLVEAGNAARGDLLEIKAQLAAEELNVTNANNELNIAYLNLTQLLDLDSVGGFDIVVPDTVEPDFAAGVTDVYDVYADALDYLPHVKSAEYALKAYEKNLLIEKGRLSPQLSLGGSWSSGYSDSRYRTYEGELVETEIGYLQSDPNQIVVSQIAPTLYEDFPYRDQIEANSAKSLYFTLSIPIFNKWQIATSISNAKIQVLDAQQNLDLIKQQLYKEIQQAYSDAVSAREKYNSSLEAVNSYSEAFTYTEQKFNVGIVNSVEYNIAKNNYIKAQSELVQAKFEYIFSVKILDFYRGIPITL